MGCGLWAVLPGRAGPALQADMEAQAWHYHCAVTGTGTVDYGPGRSSVVIFRSVLVPAQRAWSIWPPIFNYLLKVSFFNLYLAITTMLMLVLTR